MRNDHYNSALRGFIAVAAATTLASSSASAQLRAFGSAEGYGAVATGARATPSVYHVTNLNATGAGSFVDAISVSNRIIVFDVGGVINLASAPSAKSNLYIAGQTAPGGGISINGFQALGLANTSNNIVRHLRIRPGSQSPGSDNGIGMGRTGAVMLDHLSIEFGKYNNIDAVSQTADRPLVTIQNCIIADPISNGTSNRGQGFNAHLEAVNGYFTLSNNLWANAHSRNPLAKVNEQFKNNIEYNNSTGYLTSGTSTAFDHDLVNNAFIFGPASTSSSDYGQLSTPDRFYATGNAQDTNSDGVFNPTISNPAGGTIYTAPRHSSTTSLPTLSVADAYSYVIAQSGASLVRDSLDQLVIGQVQTLGLGTPGYTAGTTGPAVTDVPLDVESPFAGHTGLYHKSSDTGLPNNGLGTIATATRPAGFDADNDGVADAWEALHGMSSANAADALAFNPLGYRMIEQYVNELGDTNPMRTYNAAGGAIATAASWGGTLPLALENGRIVGTGAANGVASVSGGTFSVMKLDIGGNGPAAGEVVNVNGGTLDVYDTITVGANNDAALNITSGTVDTWNVQLGNTVYSPAASNYTGTINLSGGTLQLSSLVRGVGTPGAWTGGGQVNFTGGTIKAIGVLNISAPLVVSGAGGTINTNGFDGAINGSLSGSGPVTKSGAGTLTLLGNNSAYSGPIALTTGAITLNATGANSPTGTITLANGTQLNIATSGASTPMALASGATATLNPTGGLTYAGTISGPGNATLKVNSTSTGTSNFSLGSAISGFAGTLDFTNALNIRLSGNAAQGSAAAKWVLGSNAALIRVAFGSTVDMGSLSGGATTTLQGATSDSALTTYVIGALGTNTSHGGLIADGIFAGAKTGVTKVGAGTLILSGPNSYTGLTAVQAGTLQLGRSAFSPVVSGAGADVAGGRLVFDYTGTSSPAATLVPLLDAGYDVSFGSGRITSSTATAARGLGWIDNGGTSQFTIAATLYGDANLDFAVNFDDLLILAQGYGSTSGTWMTGDTNYDGLVNFDDLLKLAQNYGSAATLESDWQLARSIVPEPGVIGVAVLAGLRSGRRSRQ